MQSFSEIVDQLVLRAVNLDGLFLALKLKTANRYNLPVRTLSLRIFANNWSIFASSPSIVRKNNPQKQLLPTRLPSIRDSRLPTIIAKDGALKRLTKALHDQKASSELILLTVRLLRAMLLAMTNSKNPRSFYYSLICVISG